MNQYKCDACGNAVCWCFPKEPWGPGELCPYDVGVPVNWRKARYKPTVTKKKPKNEPCPNCGSKERVMGFPWPHCKNGDYVFVGKELFP